MFLHKPLLPENIEDMEEGIIYKDNGSNNHILYCCDDCGTPMKVKVIKGNPMWRLCRDCSNKRRRMYPDLPKNIEDMVYGIIYRREYGESVGLMYCSGCNIRLIRRYEYGKLPESAMCIDCFNKTPEKRKIMSDAHLGTHWTEDQKQKQSKANREKYANNLEYREHVNKANKARAGRIVSEEVREKLRVANKGQKHTEEQDKAHSIRMKEVYADPNNKTLWMGRMFKGMALKPTKPEKYLDALLQEYYPNTWLYNGDGSCQFRIDHKIPDFISPYHSDKVIELFSYHHCPVLNKNIKSNAIGKERLKLFKDHGYDCLIIWEPELANPDLVADKIKEFIQAS